MTTREWVRVWVLLALLALIFLASGYRAEATTATIDHEEVCLDSGEWQVVWLVTNEDPRPMVVVDQDPVLWPGVIPGNTVAEAQPIRLPNDALGTSASLFGTWAEGEVINLVGIVDLRGEQCATTTTPSTTPTTSSSTTTPSAGLPTTSTSVRQPSPSTTPEPTLTSSTASTVPVPSTTPSQLPFTGMADLLIPAAVVAFGAVVLGVLAARAGR